MRFRVSSQRCGGVQRGLNPKWLLLSQHSTVWPVVRIILGSVSGRYSEPSWTCGCGKFVGFSRRVAEESVENPAAAAEHCAAAAARHRGNRLDCAAMALHNARSSGSAMARDFVCQELRRNDFDRKRRLELEDPCLRLTFLGIQRSMSKVVCY